MADDRALLDRGLEVTKQLWGERSGGGGMPAQKLGPVPGSTSGAAVCARSRSSPHWERPTSSRAT